jgi:hypothetical protein
MGRKKIFFVLCRLNCTENPIYVIPEMKLRRLVPNSCIHVSLWVIYIFQWLICLFGCSKIGRKILGIYKSLTDTWMWKLEDGTLKFYIGNNEATHFHSWENINQNQKFILDSHRPFICSVEQRRQDKNLIYLLRSAEGTNQGRTPFICSVESSFASNSTVSSGQPSLFSLVAT